MAPRLAFLLALFTLVAYTHAVPLRYKNTNTHHEHHKSNDDVVRSTLSAAGPTLPSPQSQTFTWDDATTPEEFHRLSQRAASDQECTPRNAGSYKDAPVSWRAGIDRGDILYSNNVTGKPLPPLANGYLGTFVLSDAVYAAGVFNGALNLTSKPMRASVRARIPATNAFTLGPEVERVHYALDLRQGIFQIESVCTNHLQVRTRHSRRAPVAAARVSGGGASGGQDVDNGCRVTETWFAHRSRRSLLVYHVEITGGASGVLTTVQNKAGPPSKDIRFNTTWSAGNYTFMSGSTVATESPDIPPDTVAVIYDTVQGDIQVPSGQNLSMTFVTALRSSLDSSDPATEALDDYNAAKALPYSALLSEHVAAMAALQTAGIDVDCLSLAQNINSSMFYIQSAVRSDWPYSLSPGGLSSNGYNGHTFWDCETWMAPNLFLLNPAIGKSIFDYRYNRLAGAETKAKSYDKGYQGAMFPWESAFSGLEEATANTGYFEQHISGDVIFALRQYWRLSQDLDWARERAWPIAEKVAMFWASRVQERRPDPAHSAQPVQYIIQHVTPPDEYAVNVNNSVYTNVVASISLQFAAELAQVLGQAAPAQWKDIAANMYIPFDQEKQIHLEFDTYHGEIIKQADVILLGYPLGYPMSRTVRYNDLVYYSNKTTSTGPAMTWGMEAVGLLELGRVQEAIPVFRRSYANIHPPFSIWLETPTGGTLNFITGAGGWLQTLWAGYGGLRINANSLDFNVQSPPGVKRFVMRKFTYLQHQISITLDSNSGLTTVEDFLTLSTAPALQVVTAQGTYTLTPAQPVNLQGGKFQISVASP